MQKCISVQLYASQEQNTDAQGELLYNALFLLITFKLYTAKSAFCIKYVNFLSHDNN